MVFNVHSPFINMLQLILAFGKRAPLLKNLPSMYLFTAHGMHLSRVNHYLLHGIHDTCTVRIVFLLCILNPVWSFSDKGPSCGGINKLILLILMHYRGLSFPVLVLYTKHGCKSSQILSGVIYGRIRLTQRSCDTIRSYQCKTSI